MSAWDSINKKTNWQPAPYFQFYQISFGVNEYRRTLLYSVDKGFGYLLRYVTLAYFTNVTGSGPNYYYLDPPELEFYVRRQTRQTEPLPIRQLCSPCDTMDNDWQHQPYNIAAPLKSHKILNYFYQYGDTMQIDVTRLPNQLDTIGRSPTQVVSLVVKGYNVPEPQERIW